MPQSDYGFGREWSSFSPPGNSVRSNKKGGDYWEGRYGNCLQSPIRRKCCCFQRICWNCRTLPIPKRSGHDEVFIFLFIFIVLFLKHYPFSLLKHPCLVNIIGAGIIKETNNLFLVSEFVARGDLYNILHDKNKTPVANEIIVQWALDIAHGMQYLHSLGVIHRDLKSLNILVSNFF